MRTVAIIPARWGSTRFPGKPLAMIGGKPMIQHVYENVSQVTKEVWVATDDPRIFDAVESFKGQVLLTPSDITNGTDRCAAAIRLLNIHPRSTDIKILNVQGDEPMLQPHILHYFLRVLGNIDLGTLISPLTMQSFDNLHRVKSSTIDDSHNSIALTFSRRMIYGYKNYHHIGVYAYDPNILYELSKLTNPPDIENLEQVRWMNAGYCIKCIKTPYNGLSVDTPEDLEAVKKALGYE